MRRQRLLLLGTVLSILLTLLALAAKFVIGAWMPFMYVLLGFSVLLLGFVVFYTRVTWGRFFGHKTTKRSLSSGLQLILGLVVLAGVNVFVVKNPVIVDMTEQSYLGLTDSSKEILDKLQSDFELVVLHRGAQDQENLYKVKRLYKLIQARTPLAGEFLDIDVHEDFKRAESYVDSLSDRKLEGLTVIVECGGGKKNVYHPHTEVEMMQALNQCFIRPKKKVGFVMNHGEWMPTNARELGLLAEQLSSFNVEIVQIDLRNGNDLANIDSLFILGPRTDFLPQELDQLRLYLDKNPSLFVALDPDKKSNIRTLLQDIGLLVGQEYIITLNGEKGDTNLVAREFKADSSVVSSLVGGSLFFERATPIDIRTVDSGWKGEGLVFSDGQSILLNDLTASDIAPNFASHTVIARSEKTGGGKVVVAGDSDWLLNNYLPIFYNRNMFVNVVSYLLGDESLTMIPNREIKSEPLYFARLQWASFFGANLFVPFSLLILFIVVWWRGRQ